VIDTDVFRNQPTLTGERVRLEPLTSAVLTDYLATLDDREAQRLTGSHERPDPDRIAQWLATRQDHHDRADWARNTPSAMRMATSTPARGGCTRNAGSCWRADCARPCAGTASGTTSSS
jgi:hypothetical protein